MTDVNTILLDLPVAVRSFVRGNPDGSATIVINARLSAEDRLRHYEHEVEHLLREDLCSTEPADQIEARAHGGRQ